MPLPAKKPAKRGLGGLSQNAFRAGELFEDSLKRLELQHRAKAHWDDALRSDGASKHAAMALALHFGGAR